MQTQCEISECVHGHFRDFNIILPSNSKAGLNYCAKVMMSFRFISSLNSNLIDFDLNYSI